MGGGIGKGRNLLQHGFDDQRAHVPRKEAARVPADFQSPARLSGAVEVGERDDARPAGQRNDSEVDAAAGHSV